MSMNKYLENLGIEIDSNSDLHNLISINSPEELLSFFVVNRAFMDATQKSINKQIRRDARKFLASDDCEAYAQDFSLNPKKFIRKIREFLESGAVSRPSSKIMRLTP